MKIHFYCISLIRATARRERIRSLAAKAGINLIILDAVSGDSLSDEEARRMGYDGKQRAKAFIDLTKNEIGCVISHKIALMRMLEDDTDYAVILEDDAKFEQDISIKVEQIIWAINTFDIVKLESRNGLDGITLKKLPDFSLYVPRNASNGSSGILYSRRGARKVLNSLGSFSYAFDTHIGFSWKWNLITLEIYPALVIGDNMKGSTIGVRPKSAGKYGIIPALRRRLYRIEHTSIKRVFMAYALLYLKINPKKT